MAAAASAPPAPGRRPRRQRSPHRRPMAGALSWLIAAAAILLATLGYGYAVYEPRVPVFDEFIYLQHALSLHDYGVFSEHYRVDGPTPAPGAYVGPGYPAFLSLLFRVDPTLTELARCVVARAAACQPGLGLSYALQLLVAAVSVFLVYLGGVLVFAHRGIAALAAAVFLVATEVPAYFANHVLTENLVVPLSFAAGLTLVLAVRRRRLAWFAAVGVLLALTALVRPQYFYFGLLCLAIGLVATIVMVRREPLWAKAAVVFGLAFIVVSGSWVLRNAVVLDAARFNIGYGAQSLSSRVAYNRMTGTEWVAAWIYWLPDFGDDLAGAIFGDDVVRRLSISNPENFVYETRSEIRRRMLDQPPGVDPVAWLVRAEVLSDPLKHLAVSLVMAWQGLFVAQYVGLVGVIALAWAALGGLRGARRRDLLLLAAPPILLLGAQANVSVSIPRYNLPLLLPLILAASYAAWQLAAAAALLSSLSRRPQRP